MSSPVELMLCKVSAGHCVLDTICLDLLFVRERKRVLQLRKCKKKSEEDLCSSAVNGRFCAPQTILPSSVLEVRESQAMQLAAGLCQQQRQLRRLRNLSAQ